MAFFGRKKEDDSAGMSMDEGMPPDTGPDQGYGEQGMGQGYEQDYSQYGGGYDQGQGQYPPEANAAAEQQFPPQGMAQPPAPELDHSRIEEVAEAVVEEKWKEKKKEMDKLMEWKEEVTNKLSQLQQQIDDLKGSFDNLHKGVLGKISEYDENLTNVGTEIKAMEQVFSKVLPSFTDSVNRLQRISNAPGVIVKKKQI